MACSTAARALLSEVLNCALAGVEVGAGESLVRDGVDPVDADVAQVGEGGVVGEDVRQAGCGVGVRVVAGAVHGDRADRDEGAVEGGGDLQVHAGVAGLGGEQVRYVGPVPGRAHRAVDQHRSPSDDLAGVGYDLGQDVADHGSQQVPAAADGGLADPEHRPGEVLGHVLAYQAHHQGHRAEQPQREGSTRGDELVTAQPVYPGHQIGELLIVQSCHSLVPQQLLPASFRCLPDNETERQELLHFKRDTRSRADRYPGVALRDIP